MHSKLVSMQTLFCAHFPNSIANATFRFVRVFFGLLKLCYSHRTRNSGSLAAFLRILTGTYFKDSKSSSIPNRCCCLMSSHTCATNGSMSLFVLFSRNRFFMFCCFLSYKRSSSFLSAHRHSSDFSAMYSLLVY